MLYIIYHISLPIYRNTATKKTHWHKFTSTDDTESVVQELFIINIIVTPQRKMKDVHECVRLHGGYIYDIIIGHMYESHSNITNTIYIQLKVGVFVSDNLSLFGLLEGNDPRMLIIT